MIAKPFYLYVDDEAFPRENAHAIEQAMQGFVQSDVALALEVSFVSAEEIQALNLQTRGIDKVTDVLSYPALEDIKGKAIVGAQHPFETDEDGNILLGSIVVCIKRAKEQAEEYGHSLERELHYLIVHGVMHCLGYDHIVDEDKREMRVAEERVLEKLGVTRG